MIKIYMRKCTRCTRRFESELKYAKICPLCQKPIGKGATDSKMAKRIAERRLREDEDERMDAKENRKKRSSI